GGAATSIALMPRTCSRSKVSRREAKAAGTLNCPAGGRSGGGPGDCFCSKPVLMKKGQTLCKQTGRSRASCGINWPDRVHLLRLATRPACNILRELRIYELQKQHPRTDRQYPAGQAEQDDEGHEATGAGEDRIAQPRRQRQG